MGFSEGSDSDLDPTQKENKIINTSVITFSGNFLFFKFGLYHHRYCVGLWVKYCILRSLTFS